MHKVPRTIKRVPVKVQRHRTPKTWWRHENTAVLLQQSMKAQTRAQHCSAFKSVKGKGRAKTVNSPPSDSSSCGFLRYDVSGNDHFITCPLTAQMRPSGASGPSKQSSAPTQVNVGGFQDVKSVQKTKSPATKPARCQLASSARVRRGTWRNPASSSRPHTPPPPL